MQVLTQNILFLLLINYNLESIPAVITYVITKVSYAMLMKNCKNQLTVTYENCKHHDQI